MGIPSAIGKSKKYLLKNFDPNKIPSNLGKEKFTERVIYLKREREDMISWLKCRITDEGGKHLTLTDAKILDYEKGKRIKTRKVIGPDLHEQIMLTRSDPVRKKVTREVFCFIYDDRGFFIKRYELEDGQKLSFLILHSKFEEEKPNIPEFLEVVRDCTHETKFYSYNITAPGYVFDEVI